MSSVKWAICRVYEYKHPMLREASLHITWEYNSFSSVDLGGAFIMRSDEAYRGQTPYVLPTGTCAPGTTANELVRKHGKRHPELRQIQSRFSKLNSAMTAHLLKEEQTLFPTIAGEVEIS